MLSLRLSPLLVWLVAMIWIYPKGFYFFPPYNFKSTWKRTSFSFCVHWDFTWQNLPAWQKTFEHELLRAAEANQTKPSYVKSKNAKLWPNQTRFKKTHQISLNQSKPETYLNLTKPNWISIWVRGNKKALGQKGIFFAASADSRKSSALLFPGKQAFCSSAELPKVRQLLEELATVPQHFSRDVFSVHSKSQMKAENHPYPVHTSLGIFGKNMGNGVCCYHSTDYDFSAVVDTNLDFVLPGGDTQLWSKRRD